MAEVRVKMQRLNLKKKKCWMLSKTFGKDDMVMRQVSQRKSLFAFESTSPSQDIYTQGCKQPTEDHYECVKPP